MGVRPCDSRVSCKPHWPLVDACYFVRLPPPVVPLPLVLKPMLKKAAAGQGSDLTPRRAPALVVPVGRGVLLLLALGGVGAFRFRAGGGVALECIPRLLWLTVLHQQVRRLRATAFGEAGCRNRQHRSMVTMAVIAIKLLIRL